MISLLSTEAMDAAFGLIDKGSSFLRLSSLLASEVSQLQLDFQSKTLQKSGACSRELSFST